MSARTRCARCGPPMPAPTGRAARKRFCSDTCRKAAWRDRRRHHAPDVVPGVVVPGVVVPGVVVPGVVVPGVVVPTPSRDDVATAGGQHRCPHCRQPLAVISVIVPAAAAHIPTPEVIRISPS